MHGVGVVCECTKIEPTSNLKLSKTYIMSSFQELQELFLLIYENGNNEVLVLHEEIMSKIPISHTKNMTGFHSKK